eukprot:scaffold80129_cov57-Phaeocystis_antarctica.AAC.2
MTRGSITTASPKSITWVRRRGRGRVGSITTASPKSITWVRGRARAGLGLWFTYHRQPKDNHLKRRSGVVVLEAHRIEHVDHRQTTAITTATTTTTITTTSKAHRIEHVDHRQRRLLLPRHPSTPARRQVKAQVQRRSGEAVRRCKGAVRRCGGAVVRCGGAVVRCSGAVQRCCAAVAAVKRCSGGSGEAVQRWQRGGAVKRRCGAVRRCGGVGAVRRCGGAAVVVRCSCAAAVACAPASRCSRTSCPRPCRGCGRCCGDA